MLRRPLTSISLKPQDVEQMEQLLELRSRVKAEEKHEPIDDTPKTRKAEERATRIGLPRDAKPSVSKP
ncbi:hypothetical protein AAVH_00521 [Aphelenchoides avenae]|nr:hypothetical protein AAVH_00521 [Aphelenchus avenae]